MTWILEIGTKKIGAGTKIRWYHHTTAGQYFLKYIVAPVHFVHPYFLSNENPPFPSFFIRKQYWRGESFFSSCRVIY